MSNRQKKKSKQTPRRNNRGPVLAFIAVLGGMLTVLGALYAAIFTSSRVTNLPTTTSTLVIPFATSTLTPSRQIGFVSGEDLASLNTNLEWDAGSSTANSYNLTGNNITITAGPYSWPNFPMVNYKPVIEGDFSFSVKVSFVPDAPVLTTSQMAGMLIHPIHAHLAQSDDEFPNDWVATSKYITDVGSLVGCRGSWVDYASVSVFLRIERVNDVWQCAYSSNGENWSYLKIVVNNEQLQKKQFIVSLFAYSNTDNPVDVTFSDWEIGYGN